MSTKSVPTRPRGRPRDPEVSPKVLEATRDFIGAHGVVAASMSALADAAGVGKPTIYLRWPNRRAVIVAAMEDAAARPETVVAATLAEGLLAALADDRRFLIDGGYSPFWRELLRHGTVDPEMADQFEEVVIDPRRERIAALLAEHGNPSGADPKALARVLFDPILAAMVSPGGEVGLDQVLAIAVGLVCEAAAGR